MYTDSQRSLLIGVPGTPSDLTAVAVIGGSTCPIAFRPLEIIGIAATITTVVTDTPAVAVLKYRPTPGSSVGEVTLGTLTIPADVNTIGQQYYKRLTPYKALPGGELVLDVTGAGTAGAAAIGVLTNEITEHPSGVAAMVASA